MFHLKLEITEVRKEKQTKCPKLRPYSMQQQSSYDDSTDALGLGAKGLDGSYNEIYNRQLPFLLMLSNWIDRFNSESFRVNDPKLDVHTHISCARLWNQLFSGLDILGSVLNLSWHPFIGKSKPCKGVLKKTTRHRNIIDKWRILIQSFTFFPHDEWEPDMKPRTCKFPIY